MRSKGILSSQNGNTRDMSKGHSRNELTNSACKVTLTPLKKKTESKICQRRPKSADKTSIRANKT